MSEMITTTPVTLLEKALAGGADVDQLTKLYELQVTWEKNEALKAFSSSMVDVQSKIPSVFKGLTNKHTKSNYAPLDAIITATKAVYTEGGFSINFYEGDSPEGHIRVGADVIHRDGHEKKYHYDVPLDGEGIKGGSNMTGIHGKASSTTYGRRYLMCMIWNIPTGDDNDGNSTEEFVSQSQVAELTALAEEVGKKITDPKLMKYFHFESIDQLPAKHFKDAISALENMR